MPLKAHETPRGRLVFDLDAADDPLRGYREGRFHRGHYRCHYCLPLHIRCGRHLLAAGLRRSNIDGAASRVDEVERLVARIRARRPRVRILLRGDRISAGSR